MNGLFISLFETKRTKKKFQKRGRFNNLSLLRKKAKLNPLMPLCGLCGLLKKLLLFMLIIRGEGERKSFAKFIFILELQRTCRG
jgi:hypothetical protein